MGEEGRRGEVERWRGDEEVWERPVRRSVVQRSETSRSVGSVGERRGVVGRSSLSKSISKSVESVAGVGVGDTLRSARSVASVRSVTIHPR